MKGVKDNFSVQSDGYSKFRPVYPNELFDEILSHVNPFDSCWDCATGNGQIASVLSQKFSHVSATDISQDQLGKAPAIPNVDYIRCRAEETPFSADSFDLITVGQAVHWFDFSAFNKEVLRVARPDGVVALIGYGLMFVNQRFDRHLLAFYEGTIGTYWDPERKHIDSHYQSIPFPFSEIPLSKPYSIDVNWSLDQLQGYLRTWSSVNRFIAKNGKDPVSPFIDELQKDGIWSGNDRFDVHFPLFVKLGRVQK